jgi:hypothetical protein
VRELTPTEKAAIAEAKIYAAATEAGIVVARPLTEGRSRRLGTASALALQWRRSIALGL